MTVNKTIFISVLKKLYFVIILSVGAIVLVINDKNWRLDPSLILPQPTSTEKYSTDEEHAVIVEEYFSIRKFWKTSNLGSILFKNIDSVMFDHESRRKEMFVVLIWKYWNYLKSRSVGRLRNKTKPTEFLDNCPFNNCLFFGDDGKLPIADAIVIHAQRGEVPVIAQRNTKQRWILLSDEAPTQTFSLAKNKSAVHLVAFENLFNWTMTYRSDADIPIPSGRTVAMPTPRKVPMNNPYGALSMLVPNWVEKTMMATAAIFVSNCNDERKALLKEIQQYMPVDVYGKCATTFGNACPGKFEDCHMMNIYLFYLVIENSSCRQYMTEKVYYNAFSKGAIPIIIGPFLDDCENLLPPNSFIHANNYRSFNELFAEMDSIANSYEKLFQYHKWRIHFEIRNEHGYFGTQTHHYCRICEALNYNDGEKQIYSLYQLRLFFDPRITCSRRKYHEQLIYNK